MNLTEEQKRTLRMEYKRILAASEQLLHQREVLWRQSIGVPMLACDGSMTERMLAVRGWDKATRGLYLSPGLNHVFVPSSSA
jgi:hypothetical protein